MGDLWGGVRAIADSQGALDRFRSALMAQAGSRCCHLVSTGRAALTLILLALKRLSERTRVVVPAYSCPTVVQAVLKAGLKPVLCDVSPSTLDLDRGPLECLIRQGDLLAVVAVHLYGWAQDVRELVAAGQEHDFFVVEDAAQAYGARLGGRMVGTRGDVGLYSLGRGKCVPAGRGGVIVSQERCAPHVAAVIRQWASGPSRPDVGAVGRLLAYGVATHPLGWRLIVQSVLNPAGDGMHAGALPAIRLGGMSATSAGIGASMLTRLDEIQSVWRRNARRLVALLAEFDFVTVPAISRGAEPAFLRLPIVVAGEERTSRLFEALARQGIGVSRSYRRTMPELYADVFPSDRGAFPGARTLATSLLTLPTHAYLEEEDFARIREALQTIEREESDDHARTTAR